MLPAVHRTSLVDHRGVPIGHIECKDTGANLDRIENGGLCLLFIHPPAHGSEVSPAARNTLDSARIPRASKLLICGLFQKGRVLAQDGIETRPTERTSILASTVSG